MARDAANGETPAPRPAGPGCDPGRLVAALRRYEVSGEGTPESLERELVRSARHQEGQQGMRGQVTLRSLDRPGSFLHVSCWRSFGTLLGAIHAGASCAELDRLGRLAEIEPGQAVGVGLLGTALTVADQAHAILIEARLDGEAARFELDFGALAGPFLHDTGFGGVLLLRSTTDPRAYLGLLWWTTAERCDQALSSPHFAARRHRLHSTTTRLTVERAQATGPHPPA
ncbi:hypothetical protein DF268_02555 [Streptomyces sp. V2]|uniref:Antibiotic biosynthesis monooxygenase n=1 Tax=Streptomyces niveiscabiei TaxID=164115 RepID=A0ABW9HKT4_9ACTN|nr:MULTISPECIES: antibiotic biosynthesis monooxygenase [Streptomyces]MDX3380081.1 antibiotic biosynthesis monooxygenase [Streptomyces niveiscabiei]PWG15119.1 hypothetical protein DF268_02555 [Streptomyces sp. V2]QZZ30765.1 hypothetical protein A7X85_35080 [Streptomyces sp. ST1015]